MSKAKHQFYQAAYHAHYNTSFDPDKAAQRECDFYDAICKEFSDAGKEWAVEKFTQLFTKNLSAQARCASTLITGPANFPVERMEKHRRWARNAGEAMWEFIEKVRTPKPEPRTERDYGIQHAAFEHGGVNIVYNTEQNRLQFLFQGKPEAEMIEKLKKNGFKWSPRNKTWQRQLTPNALRAMTYIFPDIDYATAIAIACGNAETKTT
jgi:hypothetical protein